jgi:hypothetical protein
MRFLLILTSLAVATLLTGADILAPYRTRAEKIVYGTPEDFQLGKELCAVFKKLAAQRKPVFKSPLFIS